MQIELFPYRLLFKHPFKLAHSERTGTDNIYILLKDNQYYGWGETVFIPYHYETRKSFDTLVGNIPNRIDHQLINTLLTAHPRDCFTIAGIDIALHNLESRKTGLNIATKYNLSANTKATSFTIGISDRETMEQKILENDQAYYKLKVNQESIERIVSDFAQISTKPFTIDANQGFRERSLALDWAKKLCDLGVAYLEQPFDKEDFESHKWLKDRSPIPIIADESFQTYGDLEKIYKYFDGINLKLMKCGGIGSGVKCLERAREMELKSIIGCMSESSVVSDAANQIAGLADWTDLDGPLLLKNDPFKKKRPLKEQQDLLFSLAGIN